MNNNPMAHSTPFAVVVNDDPTQLNVLSGLVRKAGLEPRAFTAAEDALAEMSACSKTADGDPGALPTLVVTDLYMPGIDGWRFCRLLRSPEYAGFNQVPILVVSATYAGDEANRIAADLGAEAFLPSPVDGQRFVEQVRAILSGNRVRTPLRVLIVEDSKTQSGIISKAFAAHGYQADMALTALEATDAFGKTAYDVAVLDYHLPDGTGDALLDLFHAQRPDCVCLMMTTDPRQELALDWMKRGAAAYLLKPFQTDYLIELCAKARRERALLRVKDLLEVRTQELRKSEERFRSIAENAFDMVALLDGESRYLYCNCAYNEILGYSTDELVGRSFFDLVHPDELEHAVKIFKASLTEKKKSASLLLRLLTKDRRTLLVEHHARLLAESGGTLRILLNSRDVTERKRAEEEEKKLQGQLRQAQKMEAVGRLAGGVAHDFNNMLTVILGHADLALKKLDPAHPVVANLLKILTAANHSADLTRQLLAFARKQPAAPKLLDLNESVGEIIKMLVRLIGEDITLSWLPGKNLWTVKVDSSQICQILTNLCVNARDAISGVGKVTIETNNITIDKTYFASHPGFVAGKYVLLTVSDDGSGMDKEALENLFEPFFTTKEMGKGTGLGLATVYGIVKQNDGFIYVYSEPGRGTTFKIYLPRHTAETPESKGGITELVRRGDETILLVEDEPAILEVTRIMLDSFGYSVLAASTPSEAIQLAEVHAGTIHLLVTDVVMPEMNGKELATSLQSIYPDLKCLFMSGYTKDIISHRGVLEEGTHFIQKPFSQQRLAAKVREVLEKE